MNPAGRPAASLPQQKNYEKTSTQPSAVAGAGEGIHRYLMPLSSTHALEMHSDFDLIPADLERISRFVSEKVRLGERNIAFPASMRAELKIRSVAVVNTPPAKDIFKPVGGLECFSELYSQIVGKDSEKEEVLRCTREMVSGKPISSDSYNRPKIALVAFAEYIKALEENNKLAGDQIDALKNWLITLKSIFDEEIPNTIIPLHAVAKRIGVCDELQAPHTGTFTWGGEIHNVAFIVSLIGYIKDGLGIYEIFSKEFSENLISCLNPVARNLVEIGAGRGMLSAALGACGKKVLYVSDLLPTTKPWKNIRVAKKSAEDVTGRYCNDYMKIIYLSSQSDIGMICNLIESGKPMLILQTGFTYPEQLRRYSSASKLRIIDLKIPGYSGHYTEDRVRLLACNVTEDDFQLVKSKVPEKYRVKA